MNEKQYKLILSDGTELDNLGMNGSYFTSNVYISEEVFSGNLSPVTIIQGEIEEVHLHMELAQVTQFDDYPDMWFYLLLDISEKQLREEKLRSDLDYLYMMTGIEE